MVLYSLICPGNCSGRGVCDYSRKTPKCSCFDKNDKTLGCYGSKSVEESWRRNNYTDNKKEANLYNDAPLSVPRSSDADLVTSLSEMGRDDAPREVPKSDIIIFAIISFVLPLFVYAVVYHRRKSSRILHRDSITLGMSTDSSTTPSL